MKELIIATGNAGKVREFAALFKGRGVKLSSLKDFPAVPSVVEDGSTFEDNALKKAVALVEATGLPVVADDSGLCVDALEGRPGVLSARYAGETADDRANNCKLLQELAAVPLQLRSAAFKCAIAFCTPAGNSRIFRGELRGIILENPSGSGGFGYDPLFMVPEYGKTLAELPLEIKNRISHRGRAVAKLKAYLEECGLFLSKD